MSLWMALALVGAMYSSLRNSLSESMQLRANSSLSALRERRISGSTHSYRRGLGAH